MKKTVSLILAIVMTMAICVTNIAAVVQVVQADEAYRAPRMVADETDPDEDQPAEEPEPSEPDTKEEKTEEKASFDA